MKQFFKAIMSLITGIAIISSTVILVWADNDLPDEFITYGQTLENVQLLESSVSGVSGKWGWKDPSIRPEPGTATYEAAFVPNDSENYNSVSADISVTTLQKDGAIKPGAGTAEYTAIFTQSDVKNYTAAEVNVSVITKQSSVDSSKVTPPTANPITYGQALKAAALTGGSVEGIDGTWAWADPDIKPNRYDNEGYSSTFVYAVIFTPGDSGYETVTENATLELYTATPIIETAPEGATIEYGQTLASSEIQGGKAVGENGEELLGIWSWKDKTLAPDVGTKADFAPDSLNYNMTSCDTVSVTVVKAAPNVATLPTASALKYGDKLSDSTLDGGAVKGIDGEDLAGQWSWYNGPSVPGGGSSIFQ